MTSKPRFRTSSLSADPHPAAPAPAPVPTSPATSAVRPDQAQPSRVTRTGGAKVRMPFQVHPDTAARIRATEHAARLHEHYASMSEWMEAVMNRECDRIEQEYNDGNAYPLGGGPRRGRPVTS